MADPYNPYTQYSTPTPGGVAYYPPEEQAAQRYYSYQQQPPPYEYGTTEAPLESNYTYASQPGPQHLTPEPYTANAPDRSYTPVGQPDYLGPVAAAGMPTSQGQGVPENWAY